ncbi:MAG TPA: acetyl-CoA carboxylase biotin carboxylase subunit [Aggregatilinea sp.]|jgi:acetyl-CoA carboxylase biotin carboxylase subunit|uniref:acetyl-CoA carboxylase biotin carboxylase subunit n=1 Tax=Aggregatilinea sp. TaxID=2806333 RepID=UPI002CF6F7A9|nr:acetyl-CoA carboxylase biotin carboxylase subunit [Aggregatilinea sp.]HML24900.1 acetyl-CoA carboxylase biotin carboxylase subunit [Aggregatilinea sp.]
MTETTLIRKVLVANRGEIAVRIIRACRELGGIQTVAVYSEADREALHVRYANEAYPIGAPAPRESYLNIGKLIDVARKSGADAIHPGYGFLSERAEFAQAVEDAGLVFIGPSPDAIARMGDKLAAREIMMAAGVPVVPGTEPGLNDDELRAAAPSIGYPLMVKAAAGGGGKGMRVVREPSQLDSALAAAHREAEAAFGDGTVYLEKLLEGARHIEFQILADQHGNTIHLGERECSIQRRHQKLFEESPSPFMDDDLRERMGAAAIRAAQAVNYVNAGTVEFLVDPDKNFYFLEMNTRLQVEHPVTELVTGVDMVKEQIRIARGRRMGPEHGVTLKGWAVECRINAEDPYNNFLPSVGCVSVHVSPTGPGVRLDSGIYAGYEVTPYYDALLAKLIAWGETRGEALLRMRRALAEYKIMGLKTNLPFHQKLIDSTRFLAGRYDTQFVEEYLPMQDEAQNSQDEEVAAILATVVEHLYRQQASQIVARPKRDASNWKWIGRYERMHR